MLAWNFFSTIVLYTDLVDCDLKRFYQHQKLVLLCLIRPQSGFHSQFRVLDGVKSTVSVLLKHHNLSTARRSRLNQTKVSY